MPGMNRCHHTSKFNFVISSLLVFVMIFQILASPVLAAASWEQGDKTFALAGQKLALPGQLALAGGGQTAPQDQLPSVPQSVYGGAEQPKSVTQSIYDPFNKIVLPIVTPKKNPQVIVRYKDQGMGIRSLSAVTESSSLKVLDVEAGKDINTVLNEIRQDPKVDYAEPNYELYALSFNSNDTEYTQQWGFRDVQLPAALDWVPYILENENSSASQIKVAVLDTGVDTAHEDLAGRLLPGRNMITGADTGNVSDDSIVGHGTEVSGIIAAQYNNGKGITGVAGSLPVSILPVKVLDAAGSGTMYDVAQGIRWAADNGAKIINLSLGARLPDYPRTLDEAVKYALDKGALVFAASGNEGGNSQGFYPAATQGVFSVGACGTDHYRTDFSNYANIYAPGVDIITTLPGNKYGKMSGTSAATPFVSGIAALLWSVYPQRTPGQVQQAVREGKLLKEAHWYYNEYYDEISANNALSNLQDNDTVYDYIEFIQPDYHHDVLSDNVNVIVRVGNPGNVSQIKLLLDNQNDNSSEETVIGSISASSDNLSGIYTYKWDTTKYANGQYKIKAKSYDLVGLELYDTYESITIANNQKSGLSIQVLKPDGTPASGASVTVYHPYTGVGWDSISYEQLFDDKADLDGKIILYGTEATDGNDYLITAQGSDPDFFYYKLVRAPAAVVMNASDAQRIVINSKRTDGKPMSGIVMLNLLEENLSMCKNPENIVEQQDITATRTNTSGTGEIYLTKGKYNLKLMGLSDSYYLINKGVSISGTTQKIDFCPTGSEVAKVKLELDSSFYKATFMVKDKEYYDGYENLENNSEVVITPGTYLSVVDAVYRSPSYEYVWGLKPAKIQIAAGQEHIIKVGGSVSLGITPNFGQGQDGINAGQYASFKVDSKDTYGNEITSLIYQTYSPGNIQSNTQTSNAQSSSAGKKVIMRAYTQESEDTQKTGDAQKSPQTYLYNTNTGKFEVVAQDSFFVAPSVEILDTSGQVITSNSCGYSYAYWYIPSNQAAGTYKARVKLVSGPFGSMPAGELLSNETAFNVKPGAGQERQPKVTFTVNDLNGKPMQNAQLMVYEKWDGKYYPFTYEGEKRTDSQGKVSFYYLDIDGVDKYMLVINGLTTDPSDPDNTSARQKLFFSTPLVPGVQPANITVNLASYSMKHIKLRAADIENNTFSNYMISYSLYSMDAQGALCGLNLGEPSYEDQGAMPVWMPAGTYLIEAVTGYHGGATSYPNTGGAAAAQKAINAQDFEGTVYYLIKKADITSSTQDGYVINLGGQGTPGITVKVPETGADGVTQYNLRGVALFNNNMPFATILRTEKDTPIYVEPGTYRAEAVMERRRYDGSWNYWMEKDESIKLEANGSTVWQIYDTFNTNLDINASSYGIGGTVLSNNKIDDAHGSRLVAMAPGSFYYYSNSIAGTTAWRLPGGGRAVIAGYEKSGSLNIQNHYEIAPFISVKDPNGKEIYRYKDPGASYDKVEDWFGYDSEDKAFPNEEYSTFFHGRYDVPLNAVSGQYTMSMELGIGTEGIIKSEKSFTVLGNKPAAPHLAPAVSPINAQSAVISGTSLPNAAVSLNYSLNGGTKIVAGSVTAAADGSFQTSISLASEGTYDITAIATVNGLTSDESELIKIVVDRTPPAAPAGLTGKGEDNTRISISWTAPGDPDVKSYIIKRDGVQIGTVAFDQLVLKFIDAGLEPEKQYSYEVLAVDNAGNVSPAAVTTAATLKGADTAAPTAPTELILISNKSGSVELSWKGSTDNIGVAGYRVLRKKGIEEVNAGVVNAEEGKSVYTFKDTGLEAETEYIYTIVAFDSAGNESGKIPGGESNPFISITTSPLSISKVRWTAAPDRVTLNGPLSKGTVLNLMLSSVDLDRAASADIVYRSWKDSGGKPVEKPISVTEAVYLTDVNTSGLYGIYRGSFALNQSIQGIDKITFKMSDKAQHTVAVDATGLPVEMESILKLNISAVDDAGLQLLNKARLIVTKEDGSTGRTINVNGKGIYTVNGLTGGTYTIRVVDDKGRELVSKQGIVIGNGQEIEESITTKSLAYLKFKVVGPDGKAISMPVSLYKLLNGDEVLLGLNYSRADSWADLNSEFLSGDTIKAAVIIESYMNYAFINNATVVKTLETGTNEILIQMKALPEGVITGKVTDESGKSVAGADISAMQILNGRNFNHSVKTGDDGKYRIPVYAGEARVTVSPNWGRTYSGATVESVTIGEGETKTIDLQMKTLKKGKVNLEIYTRYAGGEWIGPIEVDWTVAIHFRINMVDSRGMSYSCSNNPVEVYGLPGDVIDVTVDGSEAGLPGQTVKVVLDKDCNGTAVVRLDQAGTNISASIVDETRQPVMQWSGQVYKLNDSGSKEYVTGLSGKNTNTASIHVKSSGRYMAEIKAETGTKVLSGSREFTVGSETALNIGDVVLYTASGAFAGKQGNGLSATNLEVPLGGTVSLTARYMNNVEAFSDAEMIISIPDGTTLVKGSLSLDGKAAAETASGANSYTVPLGNLGVGSKGSLQYQLKVNPNTELKEIHAAVSIRYKKQGAAKEEEIGAISISLVGVSINAPQKLGKLGTVLSGRAPVGYTVRAYDDGTLLGEAQSSSGGFWRMNVSLPDWGSPSWHKLYATAEPADNTGKITAQSAVTASGQVMSTPAVYTHYDSSHFPIESVSMRQSDGRTVTFDPSNGVATFPYVVIPGHSFIFDVKFKNPELVYDVKVGIEGKSGIVSSPGAMIAVAAAATGSGSFTATVNPFPGYSLGSVYISYKTKMNPDVLSQQVPTETELRRMVPRQISDFQTGTSAYSSGTVDGRDTNTGMVTIKPYQGHDVSLESSISISKVPFNYTLTEEDAANYNATGVSVFGFTWNYTMGEKEAVVEMSGYIPVRLLGSNVSAAGYGSSKLRAAGVEAVVKIGTKTVLRVGPGEALNAGDWAKSIYDEFGNADKFRKLNQLQDKAANCNSPFSNFYRDWADQIANDIMIAEGGKAAMMIAGTLLAPATFGLGTLAVFAVGQLYNYALDSEIDKRIANLEKNINIDCPREDKEHFDTLANPTWIWDPSGFVYEAVESNRLAGVTTTVMQENPATGKYTKWDAAWFGQENPMTSDKNGRYGWDVPPGKWKVAYEKEGYETTYSNIMDVPPPRTEVNIGMISRETPLVTEIIVPTDGSHMDIEFSKYMKASMLNDINIVVTRDDEFGAEILKGKVTAPNAQPYAANASILLSRTARFTPETALEQGKAYKVHVYSIVQSYAGQPLANDVVREVKTGDVPPLGKAAGVLVIPGLNRLTVSWNDPADKRAEKVRVKSRMAGTADYTTLDVDMGVMTLDISGLKSNTLYEISVIAVDGQGKESDSIQASGRTLAAAIVPSSLKPVYNAAVTPGQKKLTVSWSNPNSGEKKIRIYWKTAGASAYESADVEWSNQAGTQTYNISNLEDGRVYDLMLKTVDVFGNLSSGVTITAKTSSDDHRPGGGGASGGGVVVSPTVPKNEVTVSVNADSTSIACFDSQVKLDVPAGAFSSSGKLIIRKLEKTAPAGTGITAVASPVYELDFGATPVNKSLSLTVSFDKSKVDGIDQRKLGIFRKQGDSSERWEYVGGIVDSGNGTVTAKINKSGQYAVLLYQQSFNDIKGHWSQNDVEVLVSRFIVGGVDENKFEPDRQITRAEFITLLVKILASDPDKNISIEGSEVPLFKDAADQNAWYYKYVETGAKLGLIAGANGNFRPQDMITREEVAAVMTKFMGLDKAERPGSNVQLDFKDTSEISGWALNSVILAWKNGLLTGVGDGMLDPKGSATRAQAAVIVLKAMEKLGLITAKAASN